MYRVRLGLFAAAALAVVGASSSAVAGGFGYGYGYGGYGNSGYGYSGYGYGGFGGFGASNCGCGGCGCGGGVAFGVPTVTVAPPRVVAYYAVVPPAPAYVVNQGPVYSGPAISVPVSNYWSGGPVRAYPYVGGGYRWGGYGYRTRYSSYAPAYYGPRSYRVRAGYRNGGHRHVHRAWRRPAPHHYK